MNAVSHRVLVDGIELHWTEEGSGRPLVILHGLADSQHTWSAVTSRLAARFRVYGLDLPGCGLSSRPDANYSLDWQARVVAAWLDRLALRSVDMVGHSYGGGVALWLLLYRASAVRKLALIAPGGLGSEVSPLLRLAAVLGRLEACSQALIGPLTWLLALRYGRTLAGSDRRKLYGFNCSPGTGRAFARTVRDVIDWRGQRRHILHRVHDVKQLPPIALFWGEKDRVIPIHHGRTLCKLLENCSLWQLPGAGHFLHWEAPDALADAVLSFLESPELKRARLGNAKFAFRPPPRGI